MSKGRVWAAAAWLFAGCGEAGGGAAGADAAGGADGAPPGLDAAAGGDAQQGRDATVRTDGPLGADAALPGDAASGADAVTADAAPGADAASADAAPDTDAAPGADAAAADATPDTDAAAADAAPGADAASADATPDAGPPPLTVADAQALFAERCAGCHVGAALGGLRLDPDWIAATTNVRPTQTGRMPLLWPGDRARSYLFRKLAGTHLAAGGIGVRQPPGGPYLDDALLGRLGALIDALPPDPPPPEAGCRNERDEDFDGLRDCDDPDCAADPRCNAPPEVCAGGADEDVDGLTDCEDPDCAAAPECRPVPEVCDDGRDNDHDTRTDCCDPACAGVGACPPLPAQPFAEADVQRLFDGACAQCHQNGATSGFMSLDAPFRANTVGVPSSQAPGFARIEPGDRTRSYLYQKLAGGHVDAGGFGTPMPPEQRLCADVIERIGLWIEAVR